MKKTYRLVALALTLLMALSCIGSAAVADADLPAVDLVYWIGGDGPQADSAEVNDAVNALIAEVLPNTTVEWVNIPFSEYYEKWSKALAGQEHMDLCWTGWMIRIEDEVLSGALLPLDDYAEYAPDLFTSLKESVIDVHRSSDGKLYQFPAWQGMVGSRSWFGVPEVKWAYLDDGDAWLAELQTQMYTNWDQTPADKTAVYDLVEKYLETLSENDALSYGYPATANDLGAWYMPKGTDRMGNSHGFVIFGDDTFTVQAWAGSDYDRTNAKYMAEWFTKGYIRQDIASLEQQYIVPDWRGTPDPNDTYVTNGHNAFTDKSLAKELSGMTFPIKAVFTNPYTIFTPGQSTGTSLPYTTRNPERAMMFMNLLVTDAGRGVYNTYAFGIEGKHYEWLTPDAENTAEYLGLTSEEALDLLGENFIRTFGGNGQSASTWDYGARPWTLGSLKFAYSCLAYPQPYYADLIAAEETAYVVPVSNFKFNPAPVESEAMNIQAVSDEYGAMFGRGYLGVDAWEAKYDEYLDKLNAAGMEIYIAEMQKQLNEFVERTGAKW